MATATQDDGFHEIQLNLKQLVFLFMAATVVSVVIFLLGVLVGRGVLTSRGPVDAADQVAADAGAAPPPAGGAATSTTPSTAGEKLTYANRLNATQPAPEQLKPAEPPPTVRESPPPAAAIPAPAPPAAAPATAAPAPTSAPANRPAVPAEPAGPGYAIQVAALAKLQEAEAIASRLKSKGYEAYVVSPSAGAPSVFRVRVGKFKDRREADSVAARLQKEEQFKPWIVR